VRSISDNIITAEFIFKFSQIRAACTLSLNICCESQVYGKAEEGANDGGYELGEG